MVWLRRLGSLLLILLVTLVLLEVVLQLGGALVSWAGRDAGVGTSNVGTRIVALGDSNTYGLYYDEQQAWPAQFESRWNDQHGDQPVTVINLGYPGTNSYRIRANIDGFIRKTSPDWVFLMVGFNDFWTPAESFESAAHHAAKAHWFDVVREYSRVYRLAYMLTQNYRGHVVNSKLRFKLPESVLNDPEKHQAVMDAFAAKMKESHEEAMKRKAEGKSDEPQVPPEEHLIIDGERFPMMIYQGDNVSKQGAYQANLQYIVERVRASGSKIVLLTYPSSRNFYPMYSQEMRDFVSLHDVPLIDLEKFFQEKCAGDQDCYQYFLKDAHLNSKGYELAGTYIAERFAALGH